jgi:oligoribonuclease (3'-5' exoribonuclease)
VRFITEFIPVLNGVTPAHNDFIPDFNEFTTVTLPKIQRFQHYFQIVVSEISGTPSAY